MAAFLKELDPQLIQQYKLEFPDINDKERYTKAGTISQKGINEWASWRMSGQTSERSIDRTSQSVESKKSSTLIDNEDLLHPPTTQYKDLDNIYLDEVNESIDDTLLETEVSVSVDPLLSSACIIEKISATKEINAAASTVKVNAAASTVKVNAAASTQELTDAAFSPRKATRRIGTRPTRKFMIEIKTQGSTVGCYTMQQYMMCRLALLQLIPSTYSENIELFKDIEYRLYYLIISNPKYTSTHESPFIGQGLEKISTYDYLLRLPDTNNLYYQIRQISLISQNSLYVDVLKNEVDYMTHQSRNGAYNAVSLTRAILTHDPREFIQSLIAKSMKKPIALSLSSECNDYGGSYSILTDHWFIFWRGKFRTAWGTEFFGYKFHNSPIVEIEYFIKILNYLRNPTHIFDFQPQFKSFWDEFMQIYMGINIENVIVYPPYKKEIETRIKKQMKIGPEYLTNELLKIFAVRETIDCYTDNGVINSGTIGRFQNAATTPKYRNYVGYDILELKPTGEDYYDLLIDITKAICKLEIIEGFTPSLLTNPEAFECSGHASSGYGNNRYSNNRYSNNRYGNNRYGNKTRKYRNQIKSNQKKSKKSKY